MRSNQGKISNILMLFLALSVAPIGAYAADLVSNWKWKDGRTFKLCVGGKDRVRIDFAPESHLLVDGQKAYMIRGQKVTDLDKVPSNMARFDRQTEGGEDARLILKNTGQKEEIAGYTGTLIKIEVQDASGATVDRDEVVFCRHQDIERIKTALMSLPPRLSASLGQQGAQAIGAAVHYVEETDKGGILRYNQDLVLASVVEKNLGAKYFDLPAGAESADIVSSPKTGGQRKPGQAETQAQSENEKNISDLPKEVGKEASEAAAEETRKSTVKEVKKGVRNAIKGLFD